MVYLMLGIADTKLQGSVSVLFLQVWKANIGGKQMNRRKKKLEAWKFAVGETQDCLAAAKTVTVPHTWNVEEGLYEYAGSGWYAYQLTIPTVSEGNRYWLEFGAVYHDAWVYVNGILAGEHLHSGYTTFTIEITDHIKAGDNQIVVHADNSFSEEMLPCKRSFDWANDGGMIRSVYLYQTGTGRIATVRAVCEPILTQTGRRQHGGSAVWGLDLMLDIRSSAPSSEQSDWKVKWRLYSAGNTEPAAGGEASAGAGENQIERQILDNITYWHFDAPVLYMLELELCCGDVVQDTCKMRLGFRKIAVCAERLFLNGESVRLCGTEWMPGSDPRYGMAEPTEQLHKMLGILKRTNCVYTRFHWQQSEEVYEWCDENGMLVQEEIPFWGPDPEAAGETQWEIFHQQIQEMIRAGQNHPCLISWGVGNELAAQHPDTVRYIKRAVGCTKKLDPSRLVNYVSNSYFGEPQKDGAQFGDIMMLNEYTGTWIPDYEASEVLERVCRENPHKPVLISEFGLCEPAFSGGDARREHVFAEKMEVYRQFPAIVGTIYFCLNDYRTQIGEEGEGARKRRVHGSTDLEGQPKGSYQRVREECAPCSVDMEQDACLIRCRNDMPCYAMQEYRVQLEGAGKTQDRVIGMLVPGDTLRLEMPGLERITISNAAGWEIGTWTS